MWLFQELLCRVLRNVTGAFKWQKELVAFTSAFVTVLIDVFLDFQPFLKYLRMKFYFILFSYVYFEILLTKSFRLYEFSCNPPFLFVCLISDCQDLSVLLHIILDDSFSLLPSILLFDCITICLSIYSDKTFGLGLFFELLLI